MTGFSRLTKVFSRAPLVWAVAGSLALHAAALAAIHFGWQVEAPAPNAPQAFAVVTIDAPETDAPGESQAATEPPPDVTEPPPDITEPSPAAAEARPQEAPSALSRAFAPPPPPPKPAAPESDVAPVPVFEAPTRKPEPPTPKPQKQKPEAETRRAAEAAPPAPSPAQSAARAPAPAAGAAAKPTPPVYGLPGLANPRPRYPWLARQRGEEGRVILRVRVDESGRAARVEVARSSGHRRLDRAALRAIEQWQFQPARKGGRTVAGTVDVPVTFRLNDR